tara:strand:+ start:14496 stop:15656 length:1161 start_codon:yes stop_codon:yes gene_type:complete
VSFQATNEAFTVVEKELMSIISVHKRFSLASIGIWLFLTILQILMISEMVANSDVNYLFVMSMPMLLGAGVLHAYRRFSSATSIYSSVEVDIRLSLLMTSAAAILLTFGMRDDEYYRQVLLLILSIIPSAIWLLVLPVISTRVSFDNSYQTIYRFLDHFLFTCILVWTVWVVSVLYFEGYLLLGLLSNALIALTPVFVNFINSDVEKRMKFLLDTQIYADELTGLGNRKSLYTNYDKIKSGVKNPLLVMVVDIDHFKQFNDHYGHIEGDECLVYVSRTLEDIFSDFKVIRFGGEEFVIFGELDGVKELKFNSNPLIKSWKNGEMNLDYEHAVAPSGKLSLSGGYCLFPPNVVKVNNVKALIAVADKALYEAKERRRLLVETSPDSL